MKLVRLVKEYEAVLSYYGFVRYRELCSEVAVIPLNVVLAWAHWLHDLARWYAVSPTDRWTHGRRAITKAFERGRRCGKNQGYAKAQCDIGVLVNRALDDRFGPPK